MVASITEHSGFLDNLRWGLRYGIAGTILYSSIAILSWLLSAASPHWGHGTPLSKVLAVYAFGGVGAAVVLATLRPIIRTLLGAILCGMSIAALIGLGYRVSDQGLAPWNLGDTVVIGLFTLIVGASCGVIAHRELRPKARAKKS